jgi:hypothetical protein
MTPTITKLSTELIDLYSEQYDRYWSLYEKKKYFFFDYLEVSCEQIIFAIANYVEPSEESKILLVKFESLLALIKLEMEKRWLNNQEQYSRIPVRPIRNFSQNKQRIQ